MNYTISTNKDKLDVGAIHNFIYLKSYWGKDRSIEDVKCTIDNSLCFGMYDLHEKQVGFARIVTDFVVFAYLMDVIIFKDYQGKGLGKRLIRAVLEHQSLEKIQTFALKTKDAHELYRQFGFHKIGDSKMWMAKDSYVYQ